MYTIIIVEAIHGFYTQDNPGYFVELRDRSCNSACTVGTFGSPELAQETAVNKAYNIGLELNGEIDYTGRGTFFPQQQFACDACGDIIVDTPNDVDGSHYCNNCYRSHWFDYQELCSCGGLSQAPTPGSPSIDP